MKNPFKNKPGDTLAKNQKEADAKTPVEFNEKPHTEGMEPKQGPDNSAHEVRNEFNELVPQQKHEPELFQSGMLTPVFVPDTVELVSSIKEIRRTLDGIFMLVSVMAPVKTYQQGQTIYNKSRPISICITKLEEAKMQLGKVLKEIGNPNPYPNSKTPYTYIAVKDIETTHGILVKGSESIEVFEGETAVFLIGEERVSFLMDDATMEGQFEKVHNRKIEPTADTADGTLILEGYEALDHLGKVKYLRNELAQIDKRLKVIFEAQLLVSTWYTMHFISAVMYTDEASMWLGQELSRLNK